MATDDGVDDDNDDDGEDDDDDERECRLARPRRLGREGPGLDSMSPSLVRSRCQRERVRLW